MIWNDKELKTYPEIIKMGLSLKGEEQKKFVKEYAKTGKYALSNIGYCAGYYNHKTAQRILKIFNAEHPIFGKAL
jgi:predicted membrane-bound dolichyl-phosphate-mannose-protein mannosyltransferase